MKQKGQRFNPYGLRARLGLALLGSAVICTIVFFVISAGLDYIFANYYDRSDFEQIHIQRQCESLQDFIDTNQITVESLGKLKEWEKTQPVILLELYLDDTCIYSSIYDGPVSSTLLYNSETRDYATLNLAGRQAAVFIYSDFSFQFSVLKTAISFAAALVLFFLLFLHYCRKLIGYICRLNEDVQILEGGNLEYCVSEEGNDELTELACSMNRMRTTLLQQMETEQQLHSANRRLITEMSHDLRTPLTGIMLYLEILRAHRYETEEQLQDYLEKIDAKAHHMKALSDHLFEYSMQSSREKQTEPRSMEHAFKDAVAALADDIRARGFTVETDLEWENCFVQVNSEYIHRIFENITSNIEKYAEAAVAVRIDSLRSEKFCGFSVMNSFPAYASPAESSGVGIESIRSMMKQMQGICNTEQTDTSFEITLLFPKQ